MGQLGHFALDLVVTEEEHVEFAALIVLVEQISQLSAPQDGGQDVAIAQSVLIFPFAQRHSGKVEQVQAAQDVLLDGFMRELRLHLRIVDAVEHILAAAVEKVIGYAHNDLRTNRTEVALADVALGAENTLLADVHLGVLLRLVRLAVQTLYGHNGIVTVAPVEQRVHGQVKIRRKVEAALKVEQPLEKFGEIFVVVPQKAVYFFVVGQGDAVGHKCQAGEIAGPAIRLGVVDVFVEIELHLQQVISCYGAVHHRTVHIFIVELLRLFLDIIGHAIVAYVVVVAFGQNDDDVRHGEGAHHHRMLFRVEFPIALEGSEARHDTCCSTIYGVYFVNKIVRLVAIVQHEGRAVLLEEVAHEVRLAFLALAIGRCGGIETLCLHQLA